MPKTKREDSEPVLPSTNSAPEALPTNAAGRTGPPEAPGRSPGRFYAYSTVTLLARLRG